VLSEDVVSARSWKDPGLTPPRAGTPRNPWHPRHPFATYRLGRKTGRHDNLTCARRRAPVTKKTPVTCGPRVHSTPRADQYAVGRIPVIALDSCHCITGAPIYQRSGAYGRADVSAAGPERVRWQGVSKCRVVGS
jgi:hypothetical protein